MLEHESKCSSPVSEVLLGGGEKLLEQKDKRSLLQDIPIPCLVKQPKQPEVKGIIRKNEGDRFLVEVDGDEISVSKLFVYPDFSKSVGQINKCSSKTAASEQSKKVLNTSVKCSSKSSYTSNAPIEEKVSNASDECSSKVAPPSKRRRKQREGTGYIECKPIKRSGKEYKQYWYHYEEWEEGDRTAKKSRYIPKSRRSQIERMNDDKFPVKKILRILKAKSREKK